MLRHGPPLAMNGYMDKEGRKLRARKTRYFRLKDSALFNHRRKDSGATWGVSLIDSRVAVGHKGEVIVQLFDGKKILLYPHSRSECDRWVDLLTKAARRKIGNFYGVTGLIGMGSFAEVRIGYDKSTTEQVAIKVMKKNKKDSELMRSVECEMNFISKNINHDNIVGTFDVFDTRDNLFIVMEYMPGGMLYDILANEGYFSERNAVDVMKNLLEAVKCLHDFDIVHRDIKPENVLAINKTWPLKVKLADFGLADFVLENSFGEKSTCGMYGTPFFVAPEVIKAETYTPAVDIWSLGVLTYNMLSGKLPFDGNNIKEVLRRVRSGKYTFPPSEWNEISPEAKSFINGLLELDPKRRLTADQALGHEWMTSNNLSEKPILNDRSALGNEQRKLRMSSMAIDDVAGLLAIDDEDEIRREQGHFIPIHEDLDVKALTRLFPGNGNGIGNSNSNTHGSGHGTRKTTASGPRVITARPRPNSVAVPGHHHPHHDRNHLPGMDDLNNTSTTTTTTLSTSENIMRKRSSHPVNMSSNLSSDDGHGDKTWEPTNHGRYGSTQHIGGLETNQGFALPAILSVKDIVRRRQAAASSQQNMNSNTSNSIGIGQQQQGTGTYERHNEEMIAGLKNGDNEGSTF